MQKKITEFFPSLQALLGSVVVAAIGWSLVTIISLVSADADHNARLDRIEIDFADCRNMANENARKWHAAEVRFERDEATLRRLIRGGERWWPYQPEDQNTK